MFQELKNQENGQKPDIQEFLALYEKFQVGARWLADREAAGKDNKAHLADFRKIEAQIDTAWDCMPEAQKDEILPLLGLPNGVLAALELFGGELVKVT